MPKLVRLIIIQLLILYALQKVTTIDDLFESIVVFIGTAERWHEPVDFDPYVKYILL